MNTTRRLKNDLILIAVLLAIAAIGMVCLLLRKNGNTVCVTVNGDVYATYALSHDIVDEIRTDGGNVNRLVIRDGEVFVESASCPDGICAAHRPIFRDGESIVCLPHGVVITVERSQTEDAPDVIV